MRFHNGSQRDRHGGQVRAERRLSSHRQPLPSLNGPAAVSETSKNGVVELLRPSERRIEFEYDTLVLETLRAISAWFAVLMLVFALVDPWLLPGLADSPAHRPSGTAIACVSLIAAGIAVLLAGIWAWLRYRPPASRFANAIALGVGVIGLVRVLSYLVASPALFQVQSLVVLIIAMGCILLSGRWLAAFLVVSISVWYAVAYWRAPEIEWHQTSIILCTAVAVAIVVLTVRRRSARSMFKARHLDSRLGQELTARLRLGDALATISTRFLALPPDGMNRAFEVTLSELGETLAADHMFVCRIDREPLRTSVIYEWAAPGVEPKKPMVQQVPLADQVWFCRQLMAGEPANVPDTELLHPEAGPEQASLRRLGAAAFLAVPLIRERETPWGYLGAVNDSRPTEWTADEINLLRIVGDIFLSTVERQRAEKAVRKSESRFRQLFDANIIGVLFADVYGNVTDANDAFFAITGYEATDLPLRLNTLTPPEWRGHDEAAVLRLLKEGVDHPWEKEIFHKDGRRLPVLMGGAVLSHDRGECVSFVLDLTLRKEAEREIQELNAELQRASRLGIMGEMAAGLAHEVHQPLAAIANYASGARRRLANGRLSDDDLRQVFEEVSSQCDRAASVIRNIRNFVQNRHPVRRPVDLNDTIRECLQLLRFDIRQRDVDVETDFAEDLPPVLTDTTQLSQIFLNLILNAVQAMENVQGPRRLNLSTRATAEQLIEVEVKDSGPGVLPEAIDHLFDQFYTTKHGGLGMGLAISRTIAESYSGRLELAHTGPDGTVFVLRLPRMGDQPTPRKNEPHAVEAPAS